MRGLLYSLSAWFRPTQAAPDSLTSLRERVTVSDDRFNGVPGGQLFFEYIRSDGQCVAEMTLRPHIGNLCSMWLKEPSNLALQAQMLVRAMHEIKAAGQEREIWEDCVVPRSHAELGVPAYGVLFGGAFEYRASGIHPTLEYANGYLMRIPHDPDQLLK